MPVSEYHLPVFFICTAAVFSLYFWFRYLARAAMQKTVRIALEKGQGLTPEILEQLCNGKIRPEADFRRSLVALALGVGIAAFGLILNEEDAVRPLLAISSIPFSIGIAFLIVWRYRVRMARTEMR